MRFTNTIRNFFRSSTKNAGTGSASAPRRGGTYVPIIGAGAMNVATVYRCVNLLADSVANLPMQYLRQRDGIFVPDVNSRLHYLLTVQPNPDMSAFDFWRLVVQHLLLKGNAYIVPTYDFTAIDYQALVLVSPDTVSHDVNSNTYTIHDTVAGISGVYTEDEVLHIKNYSPDGKTGVSTVAYARMTMDVALAGDTETLNRFAKGGNVRGIVSNDTSVRGFGEYQDKELDKTAKDLDERFSNGEHIVSLPGQVQFSPISLNSTDMQFLETRKFTVRDVCRFFGVHPAFVFDDTSNNYKSAENARADFLTMTLDPILRKIEAEAQRKLVAPTLANKRRFQFDRREIYSCDLSWRVKYQADTIAIGTYTVNDWRRLENQPPVAGGDTVMVSANLKSLDEIRKPAQAPKQNIELKEDEE